MFKGPKGEKRPGDVIGNAVPAMKIATGQIEDMPERRPKRAAGAKARAKSLTPKQRAEIARVAGRGRFRRNPVWYLIESAADQRQYNLKTLVRFYYFVRT